MVKEAAPRLLCRWGVLATWGRGQEDRAKIPFCKRLVAFTPMEAEDLSAPWDSGFSQGLPHPLALTMDCRCCTLPATPGHAHVRPPPTGTGGRRPSTQPSLGRWVWERQHSRAESCDHCWRPCIPELKQALSHLMVTATPREGIIILPRGRWQAANRAKQGKKQHYL